jgi:hypothetical protein
MNVELVCQPDSDSISFLAPGLSGDGRKLAFRVFFSTDEADSMSIWVMDLTTKDIKKFPQSEYRFRNEVIFTKPLWYDDDSYIAAVLFPSYTMPGIYILNQKDLNQKRIIGDISDPHFKIINDVLYCAKLFNTGSSVYQTTLYQYNLKSSKLNKMFAINDNQFDVAKINDSVKILFDKERNLQVYSNNKIKQLNIKGIDPLYYDMYFIFSVTKVNYSETTESILYLIKNLNL